MGVILLGGEGILPAQCQKTYLVNANNAQGRQTGPEISTLARKALQR